MSDKKDYIISPSLSRQMGIGMPPSSVYGTPPVGGCYQMTHAAAAPPSYVESLSHPVVASPGITPGVTPGIPPGVTTGIPPPQFAGSPYNAAAAASAQQQLQMERGLKTRYDPSTLSQSVGQYPGYPSVSAASAQQLQMSMAAAQQAQKVVYAQQQVYQQPSQVYMQQQLAYAQQMPGYYGHLPGAPPIQPGQNVLLVNGYDAGARFDGVAQPAIPPPPPGVAPNAAQLAAAAGAQVTATQKKGSFLSGGSGGGYTFW